jgi:homoserine dehydrogenase
MSTQPLRIGLFGFGVVGQGLYHVLTQTDGLQAEVVRICVKDTAKQRPIASDVITYNGDEILLDPSINVVVELINDSDFAFDIVCRAMRQGKAVVSANKKLIASRLPELLALQHETGVPFLYEASTGGSIPIIRNLEEYYDTDHLHRIEGIVNGTTNYILSSLQASTSSSYQDALSQAQALGFAESDPTSDTEGFDAAYKTTILATHGFGVVAHPSDVVRRGISAIRGFDVDVAQRHWSSIKLVSRIVRSGNTVSLVTLPAFVSRKSHLAHVSGANNAIALTTEFADVQCLFGKGAGSRPTASAVLSDLSLIRDKYRYAYRRLRRSSGLTLDQRVTVSVYVRASDEQLEALPFLSVQTDHRGVEGRYIIGSMRLDALQQSTAFADRDAFVALYLED